MHRVTTSQTSEIQVIVSEDDLVPVVLNGEVEFLPVARRETPTWLIIVKRNKKRFLETSDENEDRISVGGISLNEAIGCVLRENPSLRYDDILEHMEI